MININCTYPTIVFTPLLTAGDISNIVRLERFFNNHEYLWFNRKYRPVHIQDHDSFVIFYVGYSHFTDDERAGLEQDIIDMKDELDFHDRNLFVFQGAINHVRMQTDFNIELKLSAKKAHLKSHKHD